MNLPSKTRRRLLIKFSLLGIAGACTPLILKYRNEIKSIEKWKAKWHQLANVQNIYHNIPFLKEAKQVPALIENDFTLNSANSPWLINKDIIIKMGATLTIEAGSEIFIGRENAISVYGSIVATGEAEKPIRFSAYSKNEADKWAGILFHHSDKPSVFRHVQFENGYCVARPLYATTHWLSCTYKNIHRVYSDFKSNAVFKNCLIDNEHYPETGNINVLKFSKGTVVMEDCTIYCPDSDYKVDAIDADQLEKGTFRGNRLYGGLGPGADGIDIGKGSINILLENNTITNFVDKGISIGEGADVEINNNIITNCAIGLGVKDSAHAKVTNTTFYQNDYAVKSYEKIPGRGGGYVEINHCIIASSKKAAYSVDKKSSIRFSHTLCDEQLLPGKNNLQGDPKFEDIKRNHFNCDSITLTDKTVTNCQLLGAHFASYPTNLSGKHHA